MLILPDTSCWVEYFRRQGDEAVRNQLLRWLEAGRLGICGPVRAEVLRGARRPEAVRIRDALAGLPHVPTLDEDWFTVEEKAQALAAKGCTVPLLDLLVAAVAVRAGALLAHKDAHFDAVGRVLPVRVHSFLTA
ncbi:MAG: PIN domain-containing protein [Candidatus Latescibacterota bacterium]